jgi:hypothetical protein
MAKRTYDLDLSIGVSTSRLALSKAAELPMLEHAGLTTTLAPRPSPRFPER